MGFPGGSVLKNPLVSAGDAGSIPGLGRSPELLFQLLIHVWLFATPWTAAWQASLFFTGSQRLLKLMSIESVMLSNHLILWCPLLPLPSIFASIGIFPNSALFTSGDQSIGVLASTSVLPMNTQNWSFRMDWLDLLAGQGTLKCLLQHHSSKASILQHSAFFIVQLSHPYMNTGKTNSFGKTI